MKNKFLIKKIRNEIQSWYNKKIINEELQEKLLSLYPVDIKLEDNFVTRKIPLIITGFAITLLSIGIILFYAANWKIMPPWLKLFQVFFLIISTYSLSYYFYIKEKAIYARGFLILGIISFGTGIMLVAQIYHISAHPTNGVLVWAIGSLSVSWLMREKYGYYITLILFSIWNHWEVIIYHNANHLFIIPIIILLYLFYENKNKAGILITTILFFLYFFQIVGFWLKPVKPFTDLTIIGSIFFFSFGIFLLISSSFIEKIELLKPARILIYIISGFLILNPFFFLSWGLASKNQFLFLKFISPEINILYIIFTLLSLALILSTENKKNRIYFSTMLIISLFHFLSPIGDKTFLTVIMNIEAVLFIGLILYMESYNKNQLIRILFYGLILTLITVKSLGLLIMGNLSDKYLVAYGIGAIIFISVIYLVNQLIKYQLTKKSIDFNSSIIDKLSALLIYIILYNLSFDKYVPQKSIFNTDKIVIIILFSFIIISVFLYTFLWTKGSEKQPLITSGAIFFSSVFVLLISGPGINISLYTFIFNFLLFILIGSLLYSSAYKNSIMLVNIAIVAFSIHITTLYFDIFWDMFSGSIFVFITGLLLLGIGYIMDKSRKKLIEKIESLNNQSG